MVGEASPRGEAVDAEDASTRGRSSRCSGSSRASRARPRSPPRAASRSSARSRARPCQARRRPRPGGRRPPRARSSTTPSGTARAPGPGGDAGREDRAQLRAQRLGRAEQQPDASPAVPARKGGVLSPPKSRVRTVAGRPPSRPRIGREHARRALPATASRRRRGTRARCAAARCPPRPRRAQAASSAGPATLARTRDPPPVRGLGLHVAQRDGALAGRLRACARAARAASSRSDDAPSTTRPAAPSTISGSPSRSASTASPRPATIGRPSERATIAACAVAPPPASAIARTPCRALRCRPARGRRRRAPVPSLRALRSGHGSGQSRGAAAEAADVVGAGGEHRVGQPGQQVRLRRAGGEDRVGRRHPLLADELLDGLLEARVASHQRSGRHDLRVLRATARPPVARRGRRVAPRPGPAPSVHERARRPEPPRRRASAPAAGAVSRHTVPAAMPGDAGTPRSSRSPIGLSSTPRAPPPRAAPA